MNQTIQEIRNRKSVRRYTEQPITDKEKEMIFDAIMQAPSAGNMALYSVIEVTDQEIKDKLAISCDNQPFIAKAPLLLIFLADYKRWFDLFQHYNSKVRTLDVGDLFLSMSDTLIAAQNAVVAAESLGIGSCYIGDILERYEYHKELLKLPKYVVPVGMLCFGYPTDGQEKREKPARFDKKYVFHTNQYMNSEIDTLKTMIKERQGYDDAKVDSWITDFSKRKFDCDFSIEMNRSVNEILADWQK